MVAVSLLGGATSIVSANTTNADQTATTMSASKDTKKVVYLDANIPVTLGDKDTTVFVKGVKGTPGERTYLNPPTINGYHLEDPGAGVTMTMSKDGKSWSYGGWPVYVKDSAGSGSSSNNSNSSSNTNSNSSSHATGNAGSNGGSNSNSNSTSSANKTTTGSADAVAKAKTQATNTINNAKGVTPTMKAQANSQVNKATTAAGTKAVTDAMTKPADTKTGDVQTGETHVIRNLVIAMTAAISATALGAFIIKKVSKQK
ncbi:hypothetical protein [Dellaglioa algida]|nr:hypothetical protein [Dellaglioa algida]MDK1719563.1 hypothetical protein [Dellaglioa algida]MDK1722906.1 hypothetical protein [Dellaglioa algida]